MLRFLITCIGCGCDDDSACVDIEGVPCFWVRKDEDAGLGVCSHCLGDVARFDTGDRQLYDQVDEDDDSELLLPGDDDFDSTLELLE